MRIEEEIKLDYSDVLFRPKRSTLKSRSEVDLKRKYKFKPSKLTWEGVPIIASNMEGVGEVDIAKKLSSFKMMTALTKQHGDREIKDLQKNKSIHNYVALSCGTSKESYTRLNNVLKKNPKFKFICIDVANGYSENFSKFVSDVRKKHPTKTIIAGNVVTADMTQELVLSGADIVKVGIGPGSVCTTRIQTGVGYPQLSAVIECADAAHGLNAHIIADGGCVSSGDIVKAFAGGADFVMIGGMLAGHAECDGTVENGVMKFYGMASESAMTRHDNHNTYRGVEGKTVEVEYRGKADETVKDILSGIRSACTYVGANRLKTLSKCTTFVRVNSTHNTIYEN